MSVPANSRAYWIERIGAAWRAGFESVIETGRALIEAKAQLAHGEFIDVVERELPFKRHTAIRLMAIAKDERLSNDTHVHHLPNHWGTLYELTKLPDDEFQARIEDGTINPEMERKDVPRARSVELPRPARAETCSVEDLAAIAGRQFGAVYADPPWLYGNQGTRASTGNHYGGMTVDEICALPIAALAAPQAHLHLWTTNAFLFEAKRVLEAWGFEYKSCFVWVKTQMGIGNYWRVSHEFMLLGVRGNLVFADKAQMSWLEAARGRHSAKPEKVRAIIERVSPGPYLELFAREPAEGWTVWGNEIDRNLFYRSEIA